MEELTMGKYRQRRAVGVAKPLYAARLGIPTLRDRRAQEVVKDYREKKVDRHSHENSYGYSH